MARRDIFFILLRLLVLIKCVKRGVMLEKILPEKINKIISEKINFNAVNEIRIRAEKPISINIKGRNFFLCENGITSNYNNSIFASKIMIEDIIFRASECSIYSVNEQIKRGYIITDKAVRLRLGGNLIEESGHIKTMTNFCCVNIRIPHIIKNCSLSAFPYIFRHDEIENTLVVSPAGAGKTTFLRDFVNQLDERNIPLNILLLDERGELDFGIKSNFVDKIAFSNKKTGFENGIRSLAPDLIVTDELGHEDDVEAVRFACTSGVKILATTHCESMENFVKKPMFQTIIKEKLFKRYVFLSKRNGPGTFEGVYDENFSRILGLKD